MKYLILNADDFGYCEEQTAAISELYDKGLITSASILAVAGDSENACKIAREKNIHVGVHLAITSDEENRRFHPVSNAESISDEYGLRHDFKDIFLKTRRKDVRTELEAQLRFLDDRGVQPDHADCHSGALYGLNLRRFYLDVFSFCRIHNLPLRLPLSDGFVKRQIGREIPHPLKKLISSITSKAVIMGIPVPDDIISNPWNVEKIGTKENLENYYLKALDETADGVTEMFLHPSYNADFGQEWQKRVWEREILESGKIISKAKKLGFTMINYSDLKLIKENCG